MANLNFYMLSFVLNELFQMSWEASVRRAGAYNSNRTTSYSAHQKNVYEFRDLMMQFYFRELHPHYIKECSELQHIANLKRFSEYGTSIGGDIFDERGYRMGLAQKYLNMLLKTLWVLKQIPVPPHCPVDRIVLDKSGSGHDITWTEMTTLDEYLLAIGLLREMADAQGEPLAYWELKHFSRRFQSPIHMMLPQI